MVGLEEKGDGLQWKRGKMEDEEKVRIAELKVLERQRKERCSLSGLSFSSLFYCC